MKAPVSVLSLALAASLLAGCSGPPAPVEVVKVADPVVTATPSPAGTVAPVKAASWDPVRHPDRVKREDFIARVASEYEVWRAGESWRVSGAGWEPGEEITVVLERGPGRGLAGKPVRAVADASGNFVVAYAVPADAAPAPAYELRATGRMGLGDSQLVTVVAPG